MSSALSFRLQCQLGVNWCVESGEIAALELRERGGGDHYGVVGGERGGRKMNRDSEIQLRGCLPQTAVTGYTSEIRNERAPICSALGRARASSSVTTVC